MIKDRHSNFSLSHIVHFLYPQLSGTGTAQFVLQWATQNNINIEEWVGAAYNSMGYEVDRRTSFTSRLKRGQAAGRAAKNLVTSALVAIQNTEGVSCASIVCVQEGIPRSGRVTDGKPYWVIESESALLNRTVALSNFSDGNLTRDFRLLSRDKRLLFIANVLQQAESATSILTFDIYELSYKTIETVRYQPYLNYNYLEGPNGTAISGSVSPTGYSRVEVGRDTFDVLYQTEPYVQTFNNLPPGSDILPGHCLNN